VLGLDVGGVIIDRASEDSDTSFFGDRPLETPAVADAVECIATLTADVFASRVVVVSKAGPKTAARTREWLEHVGFYARTGIRPDDVHFVRDRAGKEPVCRRLGVTHFVDDRLSVLNHLVSVPHRYLFTGGLGASAPPDPARVPEDIVLAADWPTLRNLLIAQLADGLPAGSARLKS
jgi:hypothetical protein